MTENLVKAMDKVGDSASSDAENAPSAQVDAVSAADADAADVVADAGPADPSASVDAEQADAAAVADAGPVEEVPVANAVAAVAVSGDTDAVDAEASPAVADAQAADDAGKTGPSWRRWLPRPLTGVLLLLVVVSLALAAVFGWKLDTRNDREAAGTAALAAARDHAVALTSIDASHIDSDFATVLNGATGEFKTMYGQSADQLKPMLLQAKSVSKGRVVAASVQSASPDQAVIMLFVDAEITNVTNPTPRVDRNRILMTMDHLDGRWLTSKVELP